MRARRLAIVLLVVAAIAAAFPLDAFAATDAPDLWWQAVGPMNSGAAYTDTVITGDRDWRYFYLKTLGDVTVQQTGTGSSPTISIYKFENGGLFSRVYSEYGTRTGKLTLGAGLYYVLAEGSGTYTLKITSSVMSDVRPNGVPAPPAPVSVPERSENSFTYPYSAAYGPIAAAMPYAAGIADAADVDWFFFYTKATGDVDINVVGATTLNIWRYKDGKLEQVAAPSSREHVWKTTLPSAVSARYYIVADGDVGAQYSLTIRGSTVTTAAPTAVPLDDVRTICPEQGTAFTLSGVLKNVTGAPLRNKPVQIQESANAGASWKTVATVYTSSVDGRFSCTLPVPQTARLYRAYFAGELSNLPSSSGKKLVLPKVRLSAPTRPAPTVAKNAAFTSYFYLTPKETTLNYPAEIKCYLYIPALGRYSYYTTVKAEGSAFDANTTKCTATLKLPYAGQWRIVAYHPADALNAETWSQPNYVAVK